MELYLDTANVAEVERQVPLVEEKEVIQEMSTPQEVSADELLLFLLLKALGVRFHNRFSLAIDQLLTFLPFYSLHIVALL
ncbi:hypothetical protein ACUOFC_00260, partial [Escherichia sp. TWPC-MK]